MKSFSLALAVVGLLITGSVSAQCSSGSCNSGFRMMNTRMQALPTVPTSQQMRTSTHTWVTQLEQQHLQHRQQLASLQVQNAPPLRQEQFVSLTPTVELYDDRHITVLDEVLSNETLDFTNNIFSTLHITTPVNTGHSLSPLQAPQKNAQAPFQAPLQKNVQAEFHNELAMAPLVRTARLLRERQPARRLLFRGMRSNSCSSGSCGY